MLYLRKLWVVLGALLVSLAAPLAAHAAVGPECAVFPGVVTLTGTVDPFNQTVAINASVSYAVSNPTDNAIDVVFLFYPTPGKPNAANAGQVTITGTGANPGDNTWSPMIVTSPPTINVDSANGLKLNYNGSGHDDVATMAVNVPGGLNLQAGQNDFYYDVYYACKASGGVKTATFVQSQGLDIRFTVPAELQASFAGTSLPLGDVSNDLNGGSVISGMLNVKSTAAYTVAVTSPNGFVMEPGGSGATNASQKIGYKIAYLSQTVGNTSGGVAPTFPQQTCAAANVSGVNQTITATLNEDVKNQGKAASNNYMDTLSVTFTPLATPPGGTLNACSS
ncbi:MAG TPA: hypothetical protein VG407_18875 [Caulobacteraceae bacterium]|jgi:hypothetical protein|nr:hypothetical protein [Caulobacteraceae bacterium]